MTRISTYAQYQVLLGHMTRTQNDLLDMQQQVSSGKRSPDFKGYGAEANALLAARSMGGRMESYLSANNELSMQLDLQNNALGEIASIADDLRVDLIQAVDLNSGTGLAEKLSDHVERLVNVLNLRVANRYVFGGTRTDTPPVNINDVTGLLGLATTSDAFDNNTVKVSQQVDDGRSMQYGVLASDVGQPLLDALRRVLQFQNGTLPTGAGAYAPPGAFGDPLTDNQRDFLISEFANVNTAIDTARTAESANGVNMASLEKLTNRQQSDVTFVKSFVTDIEDIDVAEAVARLKQSETSLTAAMQVITRISNVSLLNFI